MTHYTYLLEREGKIKYDQALEEEEEKAKAFNSFVVNLIDKVEDGEYVLLAEQRQILKEYLLWARTGSKRIKSIYTIRNYLTVMFRYAKVVRKPFSMVTKEDIAKYLEGLADAKLKEGTINFTVLVLKAFFKWLNGGKRYPECIDWLESRQPKKRELVLEDLPTFDQLKKLVDCVPCESELARVRNQAIVAMMIEMPLRRGEVASPRMKNVVCDNNKGYKIQISGKTGSRWARFIYAQPYLKRWIELHPYKNDQEAPLFINVSMWYGRKLSPENVYEIVTRAAKNTGLRIRNGNLYPHAIRYSRLNYLYRTNKFPDSIFKTQIAGWGKTSNMIEIYLKDNFSDVDDKLCELAGVQIEKKTNRDQEEEIYRQQCQLKVCPTCNESLPADSKVCLRCNTIVDLASIHEEDRKKEKAEMFLDKMLNHPKYGVLFKAMVEDFARDNQKAKSAEE